MLEVAEHYYHFDGVSPINEQNRALIAALRNELTTAESAARGLDLPIYWGNRNWHPLLPDALRQMREDGITRALAFVTSAMSSYSGCRQYLEDIERARAEVGEGAPEVHKLRAFYNHPGFIAAMQERVADAIAALGNPQSRPHIIFTAHSIPLAMAEGCPYVEQLVESSRLVMEVFGELTSRLVYQSRSGPPSQPWLVPDICDYLRDVKQAGIYDSVVIVPIGFISDHMEVLFDLDTQARELCDEIGLRMARAGTAGTHPAFVGMIRELIAERVAGSPPRAIGKFGPRADVCPIGCCPSGRPRPATT
jgi:ferrochelatase